MAFGLKQIMVEEGGDLRGKENTTYNMPKMEQVYSTKKGGDMMESKGIYQDIFNVNNPKPFTYKPE